VERGEVEGEGVCLGEREGWVEAEREEADVWEGVGASVVVRASVGGRGGREEEV